MLNSIMTSGKLYLVPTTLGSPEYSDVLPGGVLGITLSLRNFIVEEIRSARRFLRLIDRKFPIDECRFFIMNEHTQVGELPGIIEHILKGNDTGLMSEAGVPAVADPGAGIISMAHKSGIRVVPLTGPSSILLALMASGFSGQSFAFNGYLPVKTNERVSAIRNLERLAGGGQTQIFIEAPYRNQKMLEELISTCSPATMLSVSCDLTGENELIRTMTVKEWKANIPDINRRPAIFIIGSI